MVTGETLYRIMRIGTYGLKCVKNMGYSFYHDLDKNETVSDE